MLSKQKRITVCINDFTGDLGPEIPINSLEQLAEITSENAWSPYLFKRENAVNEKTGKQYKIHRVKQNFIGGHYFAVDIDEGLTLEAAIERVKEFNLRCYIQTTRKHRTEGYGDRFRVILSLKHPITRAAQVLGTFQHIQKHIFPEMDEACKDEARFFKQSPNLVYINDTEGAVEIEPQEAVATTQTATESNTRTVNAVENELLSPRFRLSKTTMDFLHNYQAEGARHAGLIAACNNAGQQGWTEAQFRAILRTDINPWLLEPKHDQHITDIFANKRWESDIPVVYKEAVDVLTPNLQMRWVNHWLSTKGVKSTYDGLLLVNGQPTNKADVIRDIRLYSSSQNVIIQNTVIEDVVDKFIEVNRQSYLVSVLAKVNPLKEAEGNAEIEKFLDILCGVNKKPLDAVILKHFIWNTKRRLNGLSTNREIMPVIQGFQGIGKSHTIRDGFLAPLADLSKQSTFKQLEDAREHKLLSDNFVLFFDEMSYAGLADIDNIKRLITETRISVRRMHTTTHDLVIKNAQFIGCSNKSLVNIITDPTGMRRFWEIVCRPKDSVPDLLDLYKQINALDFELMWNSVDHKQDPPIFPYLNELERQQSTYVTKHPIDEWIEDSGEVEITDEPVSKVSDIVKALNEWTQGPKTSVNKFGRHLTDTKWCDTIKKVKNRDGVLINLKLKTKQVKMEEF